MVDNKGIVVVGGVAGGMSFAARYRRLNQDAQITVYERGPYVSFANCGLPYYVSNEIEEREDLLVVEQETLENRFNLEIHSNTEVVKINPEEKTIVVSENGKLSVVGYDKLILSTGAKPLVLKIEGMETHPGIFTLRNIPDVDKIISYIETKQPKSAVVIGAGFIGLEMAENLKHRGLEVTLVEKAPHVLPPFDQEMASFAYKELVDNGIKVYTGTSVVKIDNNTSYLEDGSPIDSDLIIMSVGVVPETSLASQAGLTLGMRQGLVVNEKFQTSNPDIYGIGDAIIVKHSITQDDVMIALASPANRQGRQLADILSGFDRSYQGSLGTAIVRLFNLSFASTGLNERQLGNREYKVMHLLANSNAGYFPGASDINLKVIFDPKTEMILGAQAVGAKGVDKRIDVLATALKANMKITDLQELELTYAPPFGSAKDIVNLVGYVAQNMLMGLTQTKQWHEIEDLDVTLLDVRSPEEVMEGTIEGSINIPFDEIRRNYTQLDKTKPIVAFCRSGTRSYNVEQFLRSKGYEVYNLDGSYSIYASVLGVKNV